MTPRWVFNLLHLVTAGRDVADSPDGGCVNPGTFFNTGRPSQIKFLVRAGDHIANLPPDERSKFIGFHDAAGFDNA